MDRSPAPLSERSIPPSLKDWAFGEIKKAILANRLKSGKIYTDQSLALELGTSKTPVREALIELTARGFFELLPRKGFQLKQLSRIDIQNLFDFREILEVGIIRCITPALTDEDLSRLEVLRVQEFKASEEENWMDFLEADREFHLYLASLTENSYIVSSLENVRDFIVWVNIQLLAVRKQRPSEAMREHEAIIRMLEARDEEGAVERLVEHIRTAECWLLEEITRNSRQTGPD